MHWCEHWDLCLLIRMLFPPIVHWLCRSFSANNAFGMSVFHPLSLTLYWFVFSLPNWSTLVGQLVFSSTVRGGSLAHYRAAVSNTIVCFALSACRGCKNPLHSPRAPIDWHVAIRSSGSMPDWVAGLTVDTNAPTSMIGLHHDALVLYILGAPKVYSVVEWQQRELGAYCSSLSGNYDWLVLYTYLEYCSRRLVFLTQSCSCSTNFNELMIAILNEVLVGIFEKILKVNRRSNILFIALLTTFMNIAWWHVCVECIN